MYFTFLIPIFLFTFFIYNNFLNILRNEVKDNTYNKTEKSMDMFDQKICDSLRIHTEIVNNIYLNPAFISKNDFYRYNAAEIMYSYKNTNGYDKICLYYNECKGIIGDEGWMSLETFLGKSLNLSTPQNHVLLKNILSFKESKQFYCIKEEIDYNKTKNSFLIVYDVPLNDPKPYGKILFYLSEDTLNNIFGEIMGVNDGSLIVFKGNEIIYSEGMNKYQNIELQHDYIDDTSKMKDIKYGNDYLTLMQIYSNKTGLTYFSVLYPFKYLKAVIDAKNKATYLIIFITVMGIIISFLAAKSNYKPIKKIKNIILQDSKKSTYFDNEFKEMEFFIKNSLCQNENLKVKLDEQYEVIQEYAFIKILKGDYNNKVELNELLDNYNIVFDNPYFFVLILNMRKEHTYHTTDKELSLLLDTLLCKNFNKRNFKVVNMARGDTIIIINTAVELNNKDTVNDIWLNIEFLFNKYKKINLKAGVGRLYDNIDDLQHSYSEALYALENNKNENSVFFYEDLIEVKYGQSYWYPLEEQTKLEQCLKQGNSNLVEILIEKLINCVKDSDTTPKFKEVVYYGILNSLFDLIYKYNIEGLTDKIEDAFSFKSVDEYTEKLSVLSKEICKTFSERISKSNKFDVALRTTIIEYINEVYTDNSITLEHIAGKYNVSAKYLSSIFKEIAGYNFANYLSRLRMNYAKRLLISTEKPINKVVEEVGYIDVVSFTKTFKKLEGITPGEYRKIMNE